MLLLSIGAAGPLAVFVAQLELDLVNQHDVDLARPDFGQQLLQRRAVERGAGECAVVVAAGNRPPALVRLTLDIGLARLALGIERVEGKLKIVLCRFARIDGTAGELANGFVHATEHPWRMRSGSLTGGRIEARQPPTAAGKGRRSRVAA